ncbi:MAG: hypothetical protein E7174_00505 [Firmicutes bacterium]|nr:hypothetical protein [Bacillota bacterium]
MKNLKNSITYVSDIVLLILIIFILSCGFISMIRTQKENSMVENRTLEQFKLFQINNFFSGEFQDNFEGALSDQFIGGETIKRVMNNYLNRINALHTSDNICKNEYVSVGNGFYTFDCGDYLMNGPQPIDLNNHDYFKFRVKELNKINNDFDVYYYIINRSFNIDFRTNEYVMDLHSYLEENLENYNELDYLKIESYETYKKYFYKTDHHWNYEGSYQAYLDIANMFKIKKVIKPEKLLEFSDTTFYGSTARNLSLFDIKETFKGYKFNYKEHKEYVNGNETNYGNYRKYYDGIFNTSPLNSYYSDFYGGDPKEVKYDYNDKTKENLLVLSSSFSNPINPLIASHFNKTYILDLRQYPDFDIYKYVEENNIDKILFISDFNFFVQKEFELGV